MMTGRLIIDNVDAYTAYGLYVGDGGLAPLPQWPQFKTIATYSWAEEEGVDADLSNPVLQGRQVQLKFHSSHPDGVSNAQVLLATLKGSVNHIFRFPELGKSYQLRYVSENAFATNDRFDSLTLTLAEDTVTKPVVGSIFSLDFGSGSQSYTIAVPTTRTLPLTGYSLDNVDLACYGLMVTEGTQSQFLQFANAKEAMKLDIATEVGYIYDSGATVRSAGRDLKMNLHIRTASVVDFWKHWYSLFAVLMKPNERKVAGEGMVYSCYYKGCNVGKFSLLDGGGVWCDFTLTLTVLKQLPMQILGNANNQAIAGSGTPQIVIMV